MTGRDDTIGRAFVALRNAAGLSQMQVVAALGISQSQLSRIERNESLPNDEKNETPRLLTLYGADDDQRAAMLERVAQAQAGVQDTRLVVQRGGTLAMQRRWRALLDGSTVVRAYQPAMVLGELQTAAYASVVFGRPVDSPEVAARLGQAAGASPGRRHVLIQSEGSLLYPVGSAAVMAEQIRAIIEASQLPNVELGILTAARPVTVTTPIGFNLYDDTTAVVSLKVAAAPLTAEADVAVFRDLFDVLAEVAVFGDEARAELERIAALYR